MKRFLYLFIVSLILILSVFTLIKINTNNKTLYKKEKVLVAENNIYNKVIKANNEIEKAEKEKQERLKREKQEKLNRERKIREEKEKSKIRKTNINSNNNINNYNKNNTKKVNTVKYGTFGRLYVSNFSVALYDYNVNTNSSSSLQTIVNNNDSAAYYMTNGKLVIADHSYQGFNVLVGLNQGANSYIKFKDGSSIRYRLIKKSKGVNTGPDLKDTKGNSFFKMNSDIIMYTCYEDGIIATLWVLS